MIADLIPRRGDVYEVWGLPGQHDPESGLPKLVVSYAKVDGTVVCHAADRGAAGEPIFVPYERLRALIEDGLWYRIYRVPEGGVAHEITVIAEEESPNA